jgi:hypothetical protein
LVNERMQALLVAQKEAARPAGVQMALMAP